MIAQTTLIVTPASDISCQRLEQLLSGLGTPVVFRLRYTPPYETFHGIRRIQLLLQRTAAHEVQPALVVDVSEWTDHTSEEYFDVTLRFLSDHPGYHTFFLMERTSDRRQQNMKEAIDLYFRAGITEDRCFDSPVEMRKYLTDTFDVSPAAAAEIARLLANSDFPYRYGLLERFIDDLKSRTSGQITGQLLRKLKVTGNMSPQSLMEAARVG
ncbi:MAG: hypothetical protein IJ334_00960 [Clostridia bacterium]|nr:hypothetical protein [Clostridia bacterium]